MIIRAIHITTRRPRFRVWLLLLSVLLMGGSGVAPAFAQADDAVRADTGRVVVRQTPDEVLARFRSDPDYDYLQAQPQGGPTWIERFWSWLRGLFEGSAEQWSLAFDILFYTLIAVVLAFAVFWLLKMRPADLFTRQETARSGLRITEDDFEEMDFDAAIRAAEAKGAYRAAVRYHYLKALRALSDREAIRWMPDKTNDEYRRELKGTPYYEAFDEVTYVFEYVWYGHADLSADGYARIRPTLNALHDRLERDVAGAMV